MYFHLCFLHHAQVQANIQTPVVPPGNILAAMGKIWAVAYFDYIYL